MVLSSAQAPRACHRVRRPRSQVPAKPGKPRSGQQLSDSCVLAHYLL